MPLRTLPNALTSITHRNPKLSTYEQGLVTLTNQVSLTLIVLLGLVALPLTFISSLTLPVLLASTAFFPLVFVLNYNQKYQLARHYLTVLLYTLVVALVVYRGLNSGVLFLIAPILLLVIILFQQNRLALGLHFAVIAGLVVALVIFTERYEAVRPYTTGALTYIYPLNLAISLGLISVFARFFYLVNRRYQQELISISETKTRLIAVIGHDLRAPINSLVSLLELLKHEAISQEQFSQIAGRLHQNTQEVHHTLNNLLNWSLTQLEGLQAQPRLVSAYALCRSAVSLYQQAAQSKHVTITLEVDEKYTVYCDEDQIKLVLRNLVSNAVKFSKEHGTVSLSAKKFRSSLHILVTDTGQGMNAGQLAHALRPKLKTSRRGTKGELGTGLGIMLAQEMLYLNHGQLKATSQPGQGTTFTVILPRNP